MENPVARDLKNQKKDQGEPIENQVMINLPFQNPEVFEEDQMTTNLQKGDLEKDLTGNFPTRVNHPSQNQTALEKDRTMKNHLETDLKKNHFGNLLILTSPPFQNPVALERDQTMKNHPKVDLRKGLTGNPLTGISLRFQNQASEKGLRINRSLQKGKVAHTDQARH